jgi:hypothetical protein
MHMARRQLDSAFWDDPDVALLSMPERLLFICMITDTSLSDDYGVLPASPAILKKHAFGYDPCSVDEVQAWRDHLLATCENVMLFEHHGQEFICLRNFDKWQSISYKRKSNFPQPPENVLRNSENFSEYSPKVSSHSEKIPLRGEVSREEVRCVEVAVGANAPETATAAPQQPADGVGELFVLVEQAGIVVNQTMAGQYQGIFADVEGDMALLRSAFAEAAATGARPYPKWLCTVVDRCKREGVMPGHWRNSASPSPPPTLPPEPPGLVWDGDRFMPPIKTGAANADD